MKGAEQLARSCRLPGREGVGARRAGKRPRAARPGSHPLHGGSPATRPSREPAVGSRASPPSSTRPPAAPTLAKDPPNSCLLGRREEGDPRPTTLDRSPPAQGEIAELGSGQAPTCPSPTGWGGGSCGAVGVLPPPPGSALIGDCRRSWY